MPKERGNNSEELVVIEDRPSARKFNSEFIKYQGNASGVAGGLGSLSSILSSIQGMYSAYSEIVCEQERTKRAKLHYQEVKLQCEVEKKEIEARSNAFKLMIKHREKDRSRYMELAISLKNELEKLHQLFKETLINGSDDRAIAVGLMYKAAMEQYAFVISEFSKNTPLSETEFQMINAPGQQQ